LYVLDNFFSIKLLAAVIHRTVLQIAIFGYTQDSNLTDRKA